MHQCAEARPDVEVGPTTAGRVAELRVHVDQTAVNGRARGEGFSHRLVACVIGVIGLAPEGVPAKGQMRHEVCVNIGKAP